MNKGIVALAIVLVGVMGLFFCVYLRDKSSEARIYEPGAKIVPEQGAAKKTPPKRDAAWDSSTTRATPGRTGGSGGAARERHSEGTDRAAPGGAIEGQVLRADTGEPITEFEVRFEKRSPRLSDHGFVRVQDADGRFRLEGIAPGQGMVVVRAVGFGPGSEAIAEVRKGETVTGVVIHLEPVAVIEGTVTDTRGRRVPDALVFLDRLPAKRARVRRAVARSDGDGKFRYEPRAPSPLNLVVWHEDYAPTTTAALPEPGSPTQCPVVLGEGATVEGKVWRGREAAIGQRVEFMPQFDDLGFSQSTQTGADGSYHLTKLPSCDAAVLVTLAGESAQGTRTKQWNGVLNDGQVVMADFEFAPADSIIEGTVLLDGKVPERATLSLLIYTAAGEEGRYTEMDSDGSYRFEAVPMGPVSLTVDAEDAEGRLGFDETRFQIGEGEVRQTDFNLHLIKGMGNATQP